MPEISQKMQIRAQVVAILNKYRLEEEINGHELKKDLETLKTFNDKKIVSKVIFKELEKSKDLYSNICAIFALEVIDKDNFETYAIELLNNSKIPDEKKFFIISLIKQKGIEFDYSNISNYINQPEQAAQHGIKDFLVNALNDPEVQIDLLDFYTNIPYNEKIYLLTNLTEDFKNDDLANALSLIAQLEVEKEEQKIIISGLLSTKSPYAKSGIEYILENYSIDKNTAQKLKKTLKEISFANANFKNDILIKNSKISDCYIGFCDGYSNFSIVISRETNEFSNDLMLLTINTNKGITSCMGFGNITKENKKSIIKRLYIDSMPVKINPIAAKSICEHYNKKNHTTNTTLPYEYIVWKNLLNDTKSINYSISEFINSKLETVNLTLSKAKKFMSSKMLETWYYSYKQNKKIDNLISQIENSHITELEKLNEVVSDFIDNNLLNDNDFLQEMQDRLLLQAYVAHLADLKMSSSCAYSFCFKNPYFKMLITSIVDKSLYYYFSTKAYELNDNDIKNNFKQIYKTNYNVEELELLMSQLEEKWN